MAFENIPGVTVEVQDRGLALSPESNFPKVTLLGVTDNPLAEVNEPFKVSKSSSVAERFNLANGKPSELSLAYWEAVGAGAENIELVNIAASGTITNSERYAALDVTYGLLLNSRVDIVSPVSATIDASGMPTNKNFAYQLANFCYKSTINFDSCIGTIGVNPSFTSASGIPSLADIVAWESSLSSFSSIPEYDGVTDSSGDGIPDNYAFWATTDGEMPTGSPPASNGLVIKDQKGNPVDIGQYISVVSIEGQVANEAGRDLYPTIPAYNINAAQAYAGLISSIPSNVGTTNRVIGGVSPLRSVSLSQANSLTGARFVTAFPKSRGYSVVKGVTGAYNISQYFRSDFVNLTTVRIVHDVVTLIREASDPFIGLASNAQNRAALENAIDEVLGQVQSRGALRRYDFSITATPAQQVLGQLSVDVTLVPAFEIFDIALVVALSPQ
jgi:hypothetical protein